MIQTAVEVGVTALDSLGLRGSCEVGDWAKQSLIQELVLGMRCKKLNATAYTFVGGTCQDWDGGRKVHA